MKKYILSILLILMLITSITSVTYAWFTYVQRKSLVEVDAGVLGMDLFEDDVELGELITFDDLAYIDYQDDFIDGDYEMLNLMASTHHFDIQLHEDSPQTKILMQLSEPSMDGLIFLIVYEGLNMDHENGLTTDFASIIHSIIDGYETKEEQLNAITAYNLNMALDISEQVFGVGDRLTYSVVAWGDYDALADQENFMDTVYAMTLTITLVNSKGELLP